MADRMERRDFLKVLGVAGGGATLAGCSTEGAEKLIPYVVQPEEIVPGVATWYRTTCRECPAGCGMEVRTREGRALKAEGNPLSPISHGRLCARGQASLHGLYDPDRIPQALARDGEDWERLPWSAAEERLAVALRANRGRAVFLSGTTTGTMDRLLDAWCAAAGVERVRYDAFGYEPLRAASRAVYGIDGVPVHDFSAAEVVVSFGADFMETWVSPVDYAHGFVQGHAMSGDRRGTFIHIGPHQSLTGLNCDEWLPARAGTEHLVALAMARAIADRRGGAGAGAASASAIAAVDIAHVADTAGIPVERIQAAAARFDNGGRSLAVGPGVASQHRAATAVAAAVAMLNQAAGNVGRTVLTDRIETSAGTGEYAQLRALVDRIGNGQVGLLLVHGENPLYSVPLPEGAAEAIAGVDTLVSFSSYLDETAEKADLLLPDHHFLESWDDWEPRTGVTSIVQPVMTPVFRTKQTGDVLLSVARRAGFGIPNQANTYYDYLRGRWSREVIAGADEEGWRDALRAGVIVRAGASAGATTAGTTRAATPGVSRPAAIGDVRFDAPLAQAEGDFQLLVYPSYRFYDGRLANRPWLQELPDPVSKISWASWAEISPSAAQRLGLDMGDVVEVTTAAGSVEVPVFIHPGIRPDTIAIQLGQGHTALGRYAQSREGEPRGVNATRLLAAEVDPQSGGLVWIQTTASVRATGDWEHLPATGKLTQGGREIALTTTVAEARRGGRIADLNGDEHAEQDPVLAGAHHDAHPMEVVVSELQGAGGFAPLTFGGAPQDYPPPGTYYGEYTEEHPRWGMAIDMERCIGCSACMTACHAENNIGIVGPELVKEGRIIDWIRIERYFAHDNEDLAETQSGGATFLPMLCQQCGNAPCEPVCPVYASYHTPDGLNAQVYNRCVGTRYCANNCPYKVRYYNYFTYEWPEPLNWQLNPDVTVREKGIMEKCTFCVQRIREHERSARLEDRALVDGEIVPACAQTCPGDAIVFGNLKDANSRVARIAASGRGYRVLEHLNTQSAIIYLKKVVVEGSEA
ncbi:MAG TPA: molybdopterin dinucleotide binding domain-containing protein [Longimicrobiales bacterium]|nr:molybdopterin dinucleotide binding domain-containing protein [Longimicrobiales bacterium]